MFRNLNICDNLLNYINRGDFFMKRNELHEEWERRIADFKASGMSQSKWCETHGINLHKLRYWLKRINRPHLEQETTTTWAPIAIQDETPHVSSETIQIKVGQATIEVKADFNPIFLANVVKVLKTLC